MIMMDTGLLVALFDPQDDKYADLPMDFADASLLVLAEKFKTTKVFTLDFEDFRVFKIKKGHRYYPLDIVC